MLFGKEQIVDCDYFIGPCSCSHPNSKTEICDYSLPESCIYRINDKIKQMVTEDLIRAVNEYGVVHGIKLKIYEIDGEEKRLIGGSQC